MGNPLQLQNMSLNYMEYVAATIYYWLGSTVDEVHRLKGTENQGNITRKL